MVPSASHPACPSAGRDITRLFTAGRRLELKVTKDASAGGRRTAGG